MNKANEMADWLRSLPNIKDVRPVKVDLGGVVFYGARFTSIHEYTAGMQIVQSGKASAGDKYESDRIELVGHRPETFQRRRKFCFQFGIGEWFISHHFNQNVVNEYHPFGASFGLRPWDAPGKIDDYDRHPYLRVPMSVEALSR